MKRTREQRNMFHSTIAPLASTNKIFAKNHTTEFISSILYFKLFQSATECLLELGVLGLQVETVNPRIKEHIVDRS
jgi:hypothetical protein